MPFVKGNKLGTANKGRKKDQSKTIWLLNSLKDHGFDYERMLVKFLDKASKGDRHALEMAHLLIKMVPHIANAPKQDAGTTTIDTLVINKFDGSQAERITGPAVDADIVSESKDAEPLPVPQPEAK